MPRNRADMNLEKRQQQVLYDKKWRKFLRRTWVFRFVPFVDFALAAGSMATGNVNPDSDFDVIVGAKTGRIFTARFFAVLIFGIFGWRRRKLSHKETASDKICLNHFITPASYKLSPPHNDYWRNLYLNLVPLFGNSDTINRFLIANAEWLGETRAYQDDLRHRYQSSSRYKILKEWILSGSFGDWMEKILRHFQISRIERSLRGDSRQYKPRIIYTDSELEFHPDTRRIENFLTML